MRIKPPPAQNTGTWPLSLWALRYALCRGGLLLTAILTVVVKAGLELLKPWPMVLLVDHVLRQQPLSARWADFLAALPYAATPGQQITWAVVATIILFLASWAAGLAANYAAINLGQRLVYDLAADLYTRLQQLSLHFHRRSSVGDMVRRLTTDCTCVSVMVKDALLPVLTAAFTLCAMLLILWRVDPSLTMVALCVIPFLAIVLARYAPFMNTRGYEQQQIEAQIYSDVEQTFAAIPAVQAFARETLHRDQLRADTAATVRATLQLTRVQLEFKLLVGLGTALATTAIYGLGARHAWQGELTIGELVLFLAYLNAFYEPLVALMYSTSIVESATGSAQRVGEILRDERRLVEKPAAPSLAQVRGHVQFDNVTFGYVPESPVLRGITLDIRPGERVALVGSTGVGKSTLVSLVPRFFDPWSGTVRLDGRDIREVSLKSVRAQVSIVLQESFLFPLTVAENIAYGRPRATRSEIEAAARAARADAFIRALPQGYETILGERGATLSMGQRQRLSIARALLKNAPLLILDEPTSALDPATESELLAALEEVVRGRTTLIIAHRLSTICRADRIVVLQDGIIAEMGTHHELLQRGGVYAQMNARQMAS